MSSIHWGCCSALPHENHSKQGWLANSCEMSRILLNFVKILLNFFLIFKNLLEYPLISLNSRFLRKAWETHDPRTDRQTDGPTDRLTDRQSLSWSCISASQARGPANQAWGPASQALDFKPEAQPVRPEASGLAGWASGRTDGWTYIQMEILPILQDFVPHRGRCPAFPHENREK